MECKNKKTGKKQCEEIEVTTSSRELSDKMASAVILFEQMSEALPKEHLVRAAVQAGFGGALLAIGFDFKDVKKITDIASIKVATVGGDDDECQCGHCK